VFLGGTVALPSGPIEVGVSAQRLFAIASIVVLTWINYRGVRTAAIIQTVLTAIKVVTLAALVLLGGLLFRNPEVGAANFGMSFLPEGVSFLAFLPVIGAGMVGSLFAMEAWNNVGFAADELKNPARDIPLAMGLGTLTVTVLYLLTNVAYLSVLPADALAHASQDRVGTAALQAMFGSAGLYLMAIAIMISTFGCNNGLILAGARVYYAMARDGLFFRRTGALHPVHRTPGFALVVQGIWTGVLCLSGTYSQLLDYVVLAALLFYLLTVISLFALRARRPDAQRPARAPGYPWLPAAYLLMTGLIAVNLLFVKPQYTWPGLIIVALGVPVYYVWRAGTRDAAATA
jgi:APA family basic amino acid/polyamine antiporter